MTNKKRLKILFIPAWYSSKQNSVAGIFIKEHTKAVFLYNDVVVLYSESIDRSIKSLYKIKDNIEDGIRTLHLYYWRSPIPKTSYFIYLWSMFKGFRKLIHVTEWNQFRNIDLLKIKKLLKTLVLLDLKNLYEPEKIKSLGFIYEGVGRL
jgi:UDP-glucose 6-dehydrogenase